MCHYVYEDTLSELLMHSPLLLNPNMHPYTAFCQPNQIALPMTDAVAEETVT